MNLNYHPPSKHALAIVVLIIMPLLISTRSTVHVAPGPHVSGWMPLTTNRQALTTSTDVPVKISPSHRLLSKRRFIPTGFFIAPLMWMNPDDLMLYFLDPTSDRPQDPNLPPLRDLSEEQARELHAKAVDATSKAVDAYLSAHPNSRKNLMLDIRKLAQDDYSANLIDGGNDDDLKRAAAQLADFLDKNPKVKELATQQFMSEITPPPKDDDQPEVEPTPPVDWAHVHWDK